MSQIGKIKQFLYSYVFDQLFIILSIRCFSSNCIIRLIFNRFAQWKAFLMRKSKRWRGLRDDREQIELIEFQPGHVYR